MMIDVKIFFLSLAPLSSKALLNNPVPRESRHFKRSYLRGRGQKTKAQKRALRELWPEYGINIKGNELEFSKQYDPTVPLILDIGFGQGESLVALGSKFQMCTIIGCEVHNPGIGAALLRLAETELTNVKIVRADVFALIHSKRILPNLFACFIGFPDPFPHSVSRRLIRPDFIHSIEQCLTSDFSHPNIPPVSIATDNERYAQHAINLFTNAKWTKLQASYHPSLRPEWRPISNYEQKALNADRPVWDLAFAPPQSE
uniref:tRNA (guanine(46)-N(7))-methyltransferase n=1 Tax=Aureoumbra lagunensis TaxID=44058 RepID=A0A7S3JX31_9STRA|mmetsp:Transcript_15639/g.20671  ORF Transcript_15639/g.20671 Transcript_15639/m.20671 type:complete len:258 (+) Transcript_15639:18-791(+)